MKTGALRNVSALKEPSSRSTTDTCQQQGQQNELPDVQFSLMSSVQYITRQLYDVRVTKCQLSGVNNQCVHRSDFSVK